MAPYAPTMGIDPTIGVGDGDDDDSEGAGDELDDVDRPMLPPGANGYAFFTSDTKWNSKVSLPMEGKRGADGAVTVEHTPRGDKASLNVSFKGEDNGHVMGLYFTLIETNAGKELFAPTNYDVMPGGIGQGVHVEGPLGPMLHDNDYCKGSLDGRLQIREITFDAFDGDVSSFKGTLEAECPGLGSHVRATWSYEVADAVRLRGDEDECLVPGNTGYCWTVELGGLVGDGAPREVGGADVMGFPTEVGETIHLRFSRGSNTSSTFLFGNAVDGEPLEVDRRYSSDDLKELGSIQLEVLGSAQCETASGWFEILEKQETATSTLSKLAIDYQYDCQDRVLEGKVRVNSDMP